MAGTEGGNRASLATPAVVSSYFKPTGNQAAFCRRENETFAAHSSSRVNTQAPHCESVGTLMHSGVCITSTCVSHADVFPQSSVAVHVIVKSVVPVGSLSVKPSLRVQCTVLPPHKSVLVGGVKWNVRPPQILKSAGQAVMSGGVRS